MQITWTENVAMALTAVWSHKFRSSLTILGIVIGITTVVTVSSLLTGLRSGIVTFFQELGPDNIFVYKTSGDPSNPMPPPKEAKRKPIVPEYADIIQRFCPSVEDTMVSIFIPPLMGRKLLMVRSEATDTDNFGLVGVQSKEYELIPREVIAGRLFTEEEERRASRVALLGFKLAETLFPEGRAVGKTVSIDGAEFTVLGVFAKAKGGFFGENGVDVQISIPLSTAEMRYPQIDRYMITAKARAGKRQDAFDEVQGILRKIRRTPPGPDDFSLSTPDQIVKQFDKITGLIVMISIAISALGLLVGGIGVMNIMLVTVTERTREIGVRKAIGARRFDIISQFLVEAMTLTGVGGVVGILFATAVTWLIGALVPALPSQVPMWAVVTAFSVSVAVGLFFGVWPAVKASRLDPVEALRYE
ncbi:MAG TPA: ABC transporter permease [Bryobacteraceae bacterium]|nr:ABC transporter permease [Bryobacteraceae bacterium]